MAHETLIRSWSWLRQWLDADRAGLRTQRRLTDASREWDESGRKAEFLYSGARLAVAAEWAAPHRDDLNALERDFLRASQDVQDRALEQERKRAAELAEALDRARQALAEAERQSRLATARELVLQGEKVLPRHPQISLGLAIHAVGLVQVAGGEVPGDMMALLRRAAMATPALLRGPGAQAVAWSPDGGLLASASRDGTARVWDAQTFELLTEIECGSCTVQTVCFHPIEPLLAVAHTAGQGRDPMRVRLWDLEAGAERRQFPGFRAAFSPDGTLIACSDGLGWGSVQLFDLSGTVLATFRGHTRYVHSLAWSPDSRRLATASVDDTVHVWDTMGGNLLRVISNKFALCAAWSPDGRYLDSGGGERVVKIWDAETLADLSSISAVRTLTGDQIRGSGASEYIIGIAWNPESSRLAVADRAGMFGDGSSVSVRIYSANLFTAKSVDELLDAARVHLPQPGSLSEVKVAYEEAVRSEEASDAVAGPEEP